MNEFLAWNMLHNRPWDTQPRPSGARTDELFELMARTSLDDVANGCLAATAVGPSPMLSRDAGRYQCTKLHSPVLA